MQDFMIGDFLVSEKNRPFIIAEMSGNHNQSLDRALAIVEAAAKAGADAIKLQTYTADTMTLNLSDGEFKITDENSLWFGRTLYNLYEEAHTPWDWHPTIMEHAKKLGLLCFSSPFDATSVDFLETLNVPCYKIASFENTDINLLKKVAATGKPIIISTGMATLSDLEFITHSLKTLGCEKYVLLKCTSAYPALPKSANLRAIPHMQQMFNCHVGLSDHTKGIGVAVASVALGARVIEKHFTLSRADGGVDSDFSLEPHELANLVTECERAFVSLGHVTYQRAKEETSSMQFRRSIYFSSDLKKGDVITEKNVRCIRPGYGLPPKHFQDLIGKQASSDITMGTPASFELVD